ncbi:TPA: conjugal transfer protein TraG N-terminal domain-containing protein [Photobacterium damselae]
MSVYQIYTFGDPVTTNKVFNAIAIIFKHDVYLTIAATILILGYLLNSMKSLGNGAKEIPIPQLLVAIILFSIGFQNKGTVAIENRFNSTISHVDNVPIGVAFPAEFFSRLGYVLLEKYEQAFITENEQKISKAGFLSPMKSLAKLRETSITNNNISSLLNNINGINLDRTLRQYTTDCTAIRSLGSDGIQSLFAGDINQTLKFTSSAYGTTLYRAGGSTQPLTCSEAYTAISDLITAASKKVATHNLKYQVYNFNKDTNNVDNSLDGTVEVQKFLNAVSTDNINATGFNKALLLSSYAENGVLNYYSTLGANDLYENMSSSIAARNQTWITQGEIWSDTIFDLLTLLEAILYAITPFIGFGILLGQFGMRLFSVFLQLLGVFTLMPILMTILSSVMFNELTAFTSMLRVQYDPNSILFMQNLTVKCHQLLAYGGMLSATMLPAIAFALVSGSAMGLGAAIKGIASAQPKDTDALPSEMIKQQSSIMDQGIYKQNVGVEGIGGISKLTSDRMVSIGQGQTLEQSVSDSKARLVSAEQSYQNAQSHSQSLINNKSMNQSELSQLSSSVSTSNSERAGVINNAVSSIAKEHNLTDQQTATIRSVAAIAATVGTPKAAEILAGAGISANMNLASEGVSGNSKSYNQALSDALNLTKSKAFESSYQDAEKADYSNNTTLTQGNTFADKLDSNEMKAYREVEAAKQEYSTVSSLSNSLSTSSPQDIIPFMLNHYGSDNREQMQKWVSSLDSKGQELYFKNLSDIETKDNISSLDHAQFLAALQTADTLKDGEGLLSMVSGSNIDTPQDKTNVNVGFTNKYDSTTIGTPSSSSIPTIGDGQLGQQFASSSSQVGLAYDQDRPNTVSQEMQSEFNANKDATFDKIYVNPANLTDNDDAYIAAQGSMNGVAVVGKVAGDAIEQGADYLSGVASNIMFGEDDKPVNNQPPKDLIPSFGENGQDPVEMIQVKK